MTKKDHILELWKNGLHDLRLIANDAHSQPSYVASVLQGEGLIDGYYDLYTSPARPINIYFEEFRGLLGFKDLETAHRSIDMIQRAYQSLAELKDRAGQHHCLVTALTLFDRARFLGKHDEAEVFRGWLVQKLMEQEPPKTLSS